MKKNYIIQKFWNFAFKFLRFEEYRQLKKSYWGKKSMKWKILDGIRYVNKQDDQVLRAEASLVSYKLSEKRQITLK